MREDDGRKLDHQTLVAIRLRAVEQVARGVPAARVGAGLAALGLHRRTIYTWLATERTEGRQALRAKPVPGRARKLSDAQLGELAGLIAETDPRDHGFAVALWTRDVVRQLIEARFGVALTVASVGRTLHDLGFSAQWPLYRAEQADPVAVARWREIEYPTIAAAAKAAGGPSTSSMRPACVRTTTPAPPGPGRPDAGGAHHRRSVRADHDLGDQRAGRPAVLGPDRHADRHRVHRLSPAAAAGRRAHRWRASVLHRGQPPGTPSHGGGPLRRRHPRGAAAVPLPAYSPQLNPDE